MGGTAGDAAGRTRQSDGKQAGEGGRMNVVVERAPSAPVMSERRVSIICAMLTAIGPVSLSFFTPAMPQIVHAFSTTPAAVNMALSLYFAGFAFAQLICGPLSDGFGRRP